MAKQKRKAMNDPGKMPPADIRKMIHRYAPWILSQVVNDIRKESLRYRIGFTWRMLDTSPVVCFHLSWMFVTLEQQNLRWDIDENAE